MATLNATHDPRRTSWVESANRPGCDFPIQNLPFGIFQRGGETPRGGVAIGDMIFDLRAGLAANLFSGQGEVAARAATGPVLNPLLALGNGPASALRAQLSDLLRADGPERSKVSALSAHLLVPMSSVQLLLPAQVRQFTDMSISSFHAGRSRGLDENGDPAVRPAFKWHPQGYNGRASSIVVSGAPIRRPWGQWLVNIKEEDAAPVFAAEPRQDYEMELALWIGGPGNALGEPIAIQDAQRHIFGFSVLNDWSARRIQMREQALGPFLGKSQGTTISPWIVTAEALAPYRIAAFTRPSSAPAPLPYLYDELDQQEGGFDIDMSAFVVSSKMRHHGDAPFGICHSNFKYVYWTWAQVLAHHASNGCNLGAGDVIGSGTCSGPSLDQAACLAEKSAGATQPWPLANGEVRTYLEDGDEVNCRARAQRAGYVAIGFGDCAGRIEPAPTFPYA